MANNPRVVAMGFTGALAIAATLAMSFEGEHHTTYLDPPAIPTVCFGHTSGVKMGQKATDAECITYLKKDILIANAVIDKYVRVPLSDERRAALLDFVFNVGEGKFARSTLLKKLNAGDTNGACEELSRWVYAGGKKLQGLVKRREVERQLCLL